ncbi:MAG: flagellar brake protein, partial [Deferribacteraceae bacterium]|nr:flagellar brake protein [Deferribacteraceae bacterium]
IEDVQQSHIAIAVPDKHGQALVLEVASKVHVSALTEKGRFGFDSQVLAINERSISIAMPASSNKEQLRQAFRVPVAMHVSVNIGSATHEAGLDDISAGGCRITLDGMPELESGTVIDINFAGTALDLARVQAKIIRLIDKQGTKQIFSIEFIDLDERKRDQIVRYIFQRQLELRDSLS